MGIIGTVARHLDALIGPGVMLLYPLFPLWPYMKLLCCMWLVLPCFNGAAYVYESYVRRYVMKIGAGAGGGRVGSGFPEEKRKVLQMMSLDARKSVERFIEKHGSAAFDRVVRAAEIEAKKEMEGKNK